MRDEQETKIINQSVAPDKANTRPTPDKLKADAIDLAQWVNDQWLTADGISDVECVVILTPRGSKDYAHAGTIKEPEKQRAILKDMLANSGFRAHHRGRK